MKCIKARDIYHVMRYAQNKKIIVYGAGRYADDVIKKLTCLGIKVAYCVEDDFTHIKVRCQVLDIYSLLLKEDDFYVFIAKEDIQRCARVLAGLGLEYLKDYNSVVLAAGNLKPENTFALDPTFGYAMPFEETQGKGIKVYGDVNSAKYMIAILGGSTSDPCAYFWKSWGELLYEEGCAREKNIAIIVGAVCGYSSSEELFKLIRDLLPLKPDVIISYSGVNDRGTNTPYINGYQRELYQNLVLKRQEGIYMLGTPKNICYGVPEKTKPSEKWIRNQRIMHAVSKEFGIKFIGFYQPTVISKKRGQKDEEIYFYIDEKEIAEKKAYISEVKQILKNGEEKEYIVDASDWFDDMDGVFYDYCHVYEEGNQRIADRIYEYLFG